MVGIMENFTRYLDSKDWFLPSTNEQLTARLHHEFRLRNPMIYAQAVYMLEDFIDSLMVKYSFLSAIMN